MHIVLLWGSPRELGQCQSHSERLWACLYTSCAGHQQNIFPLQAHHKTSALWSARRPSGYLAWPAQLSCFQEGVDACGLRLVEDFGVWYSVLPFYIHSFAQTVQVKRFSFFCLPAVDSPRLQEGRQPCTLSTLSWGWDLSSPSRCCGICRMQHWHWQFCCWSPHQWVWFSRECCPCKYVNLSIAWRVRPLTVIDDSTFSSRGAGWCMTSVFLVLIVMPKASQAAPLPVCLCSCHQTTNLSSS